MDPNQKGPFDKDVLEDSKDQRLPPLPEHYLPNGAPELMEKDFIQQTRQPFSLPLWLIIFFGTVLIALIWGLMAWYEVKVDNQKKVEPFLEVTNREMSVFLWQYPSFMRSNLSKKAGYLTGFMTDRVAVEPATADAFVVAPPDLLFLYHTWNRLIAPNSIPRPIPSEEFAEFLSKEEIWKPANWKEAPSAYREMIGKKSYEKVANLETLSIEELPLSVRHAFQGWKNYYIDGPKINAFSPTIEEVNLFLKQYPTYGRSYWRNIDTIGGQPIAGINYLKLTLEEEKDPSEKFPADQLSSFLKAAMVTQQQEVTVNKKT